MKKKPSRKKKIAFMWYSVPELKAQLFKLSQKTGLSMSALISQAIASYIANEDCKKEKAR